LSVIAQDSKQVSTFAVAVGFAANFANVNVPLKTSLASLFVLSWDLKKFLLKNTFEMNSKCFLIRHIFVLLFHA